MKRKILSILIILILLLVGCTNQDAQVELLQNRISTLEEKITNLNNESISREDLIRDLEGVINSAKQRSVLNISLDILEYLKNENFVSLATYVHPSKGLRFSPYTYVDLQNDLVFANMELGNIMQSSQTYLWGHYDGTGEPIQLTFNDYYHKFIYDEDFLNPHMIGNNVIIGVGNTINNIAQAYANGVFVEFHFTGFDSRFFGMDWRSLRLVFEDSNGTWYLIGIVHDQWTI